MVANETIQGRALLDEIQSRSHGRKSEILLITPALVGSRAAHWASDLDEGIELARQRMELSLAALQERGLEARGEIGDADPNLALQDALRAFAADEIIISTHPPQKSRWLEDGMVRRAQKEIDLAITHVVVDVEADGKIGESSSLVSA